MTAVFFVLMAVLNAHQNSKKIRAVINSVCLHQHEPTIPLRSIATDELDRWASQMAVVAVSATDKTLIPGKVILSLAL